MRTCTSIALLAAAALAALGCISSSGTPAPPPPPGASTARPPGQADIVTGESSCIVAPKKVVIDWRGYTTGGLPYEVTFARDPSSRRRDEIHFKVDPQILKIFPDFEKNLPKNDNSKKSGEQKDEPPWTADNDGNSNSFTFAYEVKTIGKECDPEICIRKAGGGCTI